MPRQPEQGMPRGSAKRTGEQRGAKVGGRGETRDEGGRRRRKRKRG